MPLGLGDYKPKRRGVVIDDEITFNVRGLGLKDVTHIFEYHEGAIEDIWLQFKAREGLEFSETVMLETIKNVINSTPGVVATIIALAADDLSVDSLMAAASLPLPVQMEAIETIGELTFRDLAGAKKFVAAIQKMLAGLSQSGKRIAATLEAV